MYIYVCVRGGKSMKYVCCICMLYMHITCWHMLCAMSYRHVVLQKWVLSCTCYWINEEKMKRQGLAGMQIPPRWPHSYSSCSLRVLSKSSWQHK